MRLRSALSLHLLPLLPLLPLLLFFFLVTKTYSGEDGPTLTYCSGDNYTINSSYHTNISLLLANLTHSAVVSPTFYATTSIGVSPLSQLTGLAQCLPNTSSVVCAKCLKQAADTAPADVDGGCGLRKSAALRYENCFLRYSDKQFLGLLEEGLVITVSASTKSENTSVFSKDILGMMEGIMPAAAASVLRFAAASKNDSEPQKERSVRVWCTMDLQSSDCLQCLKKAAAGLSTDTIYGGVVKVSCEVKFDSYSGILNESLSSYFSGNATNIDGKEGSGFKRSTKILLILVPLASIALVVFLTLFLVVMWRKRASPSPMIAPDMPLSESMQEKADFMLSIESPLLNLDGLRTATGNFSKDTKLGEGGFGAVYKGILENGQEIAVKRLSSASKQGIKQLKNEVAFLANLQHRNLVKLLGCCLHVEEKLLIYEYLPNTSLDKYLYDPFRQTQLDWKIRYKIIEGIGRGLLYLHEDSRLRIVHRDLKASNILLDQNMNPKIADFGIAKLFRMDETRGLTSHVAGTFGYMAPEYALHGKFSPKSDVYSYGVLILEIIAGRTHSTTAGSGGTLDLLSHVWQCWNQGTALKVVDQSLGNQYSSQEALRCIQIGLLCIQEDPAHRPTMSSVIAVLTTNSVALPDPLMPVFLRQV